MNLSTLIKTSQGKIIGRKCLDYNQNQFYSFQGIPYGKPPIGNLRFKTPLPAEPWTRILDATKEGNCSLHLQQSTNNILGSEDCLFLNVYTPEIKNSTNKLYPVMFWIHGGLFLAGSGSTELFGPEYLLTEEIILVTVNYRLGVFGFLRFKDPELEVPGNAALKDLVLALNWVKDNIKFFCGDPERVTIAGTSAGAAMVHYLMLSPMAKGLFHQAILQSGTALNTWALTESKPQEIAKELGCESRNEKELLHFLHSVTAEHLIEAQSKLKEYFVIHKLRSIGPVIESNSNEETIISKHPISILKSGAYNKVPLLIGYNSQEGIISELIYNKSQIDFEEFNEFEMMISHYLNVSQDNNVAKNMGEKIKNFYYNSNKVKDNLDNFYTMNTDFMLLSGIYETINLCSKNYEHPIYLYRLSLMTSQNVIKNLLKSKAKGACHGDELGYLFKNIFNPPIYKNSLEEKSMLKMIKLWANFIKTGNPNDKNNKGFLGVNWEPIKDNKFNYLDIGNELKTGINLDIERMEILKEMSLLNHCDSPQY